ncbi:MAG: diphthine synthase [Candidatus Micrarchaeota archaeon]|nr:diphthine synthase [Candidatus Micrarchaeota archaeon]
MAKGSLSLVGIGISDEKGITLFGLEELKACGKIFAEVYTNLLPEGTLGRLETLVGKPIELLGRAEVEGEAKLIDAAMSSRIALVVAGDPMIATTHVSLILAAKKKGIEVKIIHASSILSAAIGESGLQAYKFGKMVTLAYWRENYKPMTTYDVIAENLSRGLHTFVLLDIDEALGPMEPEVAAKLLLEMEHTGKKKILLPGTKIESIECLARLSQSISYLSLKDLSSRQGSTPCVLIIPAKLHFLEEEFLQNL